MSNTRNTLIGFLAVLVWGMALPATRYFQEHIGVLAWLGVAFGLMGIIGLSKNLVVQGKFLPKAVLKEPAFYLRWLTFILHEGCLFTAVGIVQKTNFPFVILINYLWPTAVLICSVLVAGQKITRWWAFLTGTSIVLLSMAYEILGSLTINSSLFAESQDCLAYVLAFIGAIAWGLFSAISRRAGDSAGGGLAMPLFQISLGVAFPISFLPNFAHPWELDPLGSLILVGYCLLLYCSFICWDIGVRKGNIVILSLFADFIPWLSLLSATILLEMSINYHTVISAICLVFGGLVTRYGTLALRFSATKH